MNPIISLIHHKDEAMSARRTKTSANSMGAAVCSVDVQVKAGPELIFMHEYCKYVLLIINDDVILKGGQ